MDIEKILFLVIAIALSVFSMYRKAKKQKQHLPKEEDTYQDFQEQENPYYTPDPVVIFDPVETPKSQQNLSTHTKTNKKRQKQQNIEIANFQKDISKNIFQNTDFEDNTSLLEDFEGTEIQKAFLYSEIFKNAKN